MVVDGKPNVMTCVTHLKAGMVISQQSEDDGAVFTKRLPDRQGSEVSATDTILKGEHTKVRSCDYWCWTGGS